ncbi:MAG: DUF971 domain-containing protein [Leptolyngbya sp. SIO1D8]|nr:DUF971 domain-containing protein [Leptolyngbya sp. SIO1D8]
MAQPKVTLNQAQDLGHNNQDNKHWITIKGKRFHYIWLRDNCLCPACRHPTSFQKINDISTFSSIPKPLSVVVEEDQVTITWQEEPIHQSVFPITWLMDYAYDQDAGTHNLHQKLELYKKQEILWDRVWIEANPPEKHDINMVHSNTWTEQILTRGFAILHIRYHQDLLDLISHIGPLHRMEGGTEVYSVKSIPTVTDLAHTGYGINPHCDYESFAYAPHLLEFIYCVENEAEGGESILVDGFKVAENFRQNHPQKFDLLVNFPIQFEQVFLENQYHHRRSRSVIELDRKGEISGVYFAHFHACNWDLPFDKLEDYYAAYCAFYNYLKDPAYQYCFRLQPGDCIVTKNFRVFHGRKAFDPSSGAREMKISYTPWDYFIGREKFKLFQDLYLK